MSGSSSSGSSSVCPLPPNTFKILDFVKDDGSPDIKVYAFLSDPVSKELINHVGVKGIWQRSAHHVFFKNRICEGQELGSCKGIVLDIGAFVGQHALALAKMGFEVHAFDIQESAVKLLRCSATANGFANLKVVHEGMSNVQGEECVITPMSALAHQTMLTPRRNGSAVCDGAAKVRVVTLDHYWKNVLKSRQIQFIKIDAEGHDDLVLLGGQELFKQKPPPYVMLEFYPHMFSLNGRTAKHLVDFALGTGYRLFDCKERIELPANKTGVDYLAKTYKSGTTSELVDVLLVHKTKYSQNLPELHCGYHFAIV